jgi:MoaA/NifB/PqqE/SkfB family radical SAM enzyme
MIRSNNFALEGEKVVKYWHSAPIIRAFSFSKLFICRKDGQNRTRNKADKFIRMSRLLLDKAMFHITKGKIAKLPYPPRHISIMITGACTNQCVFCCHHSGDSRKDPVSRHLYNLRFSISYDDFCRIVNMAYDARVPHVHVVATGEPFLHKDIIKMIDYVIEKYGEVSFQSNFDKNLFEKNNYVNTIADRADYITYITTDILSSDPRKHEEIKKGSKYENILEIMQKINKKANILFDTHLILTKYNYHGMDKLVEDLYSRGINFRLSIVNLAPHCFNDFTSIDAVYESGNIEMKKELDNVKHICKKLGVQVQIPAPYDKRKSKCGVFWSRLQTIPSWDIPREKWIGNVIQGDCNAVVKGKMRSFGNLFDYDNLFHLWNNEVLVNIRKDLIHNKYPDKECIHCQNCLVL